MSCFNWVSERDLNLEHLGSGAPAALSTPEVSGGHTLETLGTLNGEAGPVTEELLRTGQAGDRDIGFALCREVHGHSHLHPKHASRRKTDF